MKSVLLNEQSMNAGGLPQWPAKMLILIGFHLAVLSGHLRTDQAHRRDARASSPIPITRRAD